MRTLIIIAGLACAGAGAFPRASFAQDTTTRGGPAAAAGPTAGPRIPGDLDATRAAVLSPAAVDWLKRRTRSYVAASVAGAPAPADFAAAGASPSNDVIEYAQTVQGRSISGSGMAVAVAVPAGQRLPADAVDPAASQYARSVLRQRLQREPTAAEVRSELDTFDARIAQINRELAARHDAIAAAMKQDRHFPRAIDAQVLGLRPPDPDAQSGLARSLRSNAYVKLIEASITKPAEIPPHRPPVVTGPVVPSPPGTPTVVVPIR